MDENRQIDPVRYPNFAALARDSYWFRNATTVAESTEIAIPSILTGLYPDPELKPTHADYPNNMFTLLGGTYRMKVFESLTQLCPRGLCEQDASNRNLYGRMESLFSDLTVVYLHLVLPDSLKSELPSISQNWKDFWAEITVIPEEPEKETKRRSDPDRLDQFNMFVSSMYFTRKPVLFFLHILLPHGPLHFFPSGKQYGLNIRIDGLNRGKWVDDEWLVLQGFQRHLLQLGFIDRLIGKLIKTLRDIDLYDRSLVVITADHGISFRPADEYRAVTKTNYQDIMPVPLIIKLPHQREGVINDRNVELIDIVPTVADVLDIEIPWRVDGQSLLDPSLPDRREKTIVKIRPNSLGEKQFLVGPDLDEKYRTLEYKLSHFGDGMKPHGLFRFGPYGNIIGKNVSEVGIAEKAITDIELDHANLFVNTDTDSNFVPAIIRGRLMSEGNDAREDLAISINGVIHAVTRTFQTKGKDVRFTSVVPENSFRYDRNDVEVYIVSDVDGMPRLVRAMNRSHTTYALSSPGDHKTEIITSSEGKTYRVAPGHLKGFVGTAYLNDESMAVNGWAADVKNMELPAAILVFVNGGFLLSGLTDSPRIDVVNRFGSKNLMDSEYRFVIPLTGFRKQASLEVRFFALSHRGMATELKYPEGYEWGRKPSAPDPEAEGSMERQRW
jgi:hypothetical protein